MRRVGGVVSLLLMSAVGRACTVCDSATARQVRGEIFDGHFVGTAVAVLLPFPIFLLTAGLLGRVVPLTADEQKDRP